MKVVGVSHAHAKEHLTHVFPLSMKRSQPPWGPYWYMPNITVFTKGCKNQTLTIPGSSFYT